MNIKLLSGGSGGRGRGYCSSAGGGPVTTEKKLIYASNDSNNPGDNITVLGSVSDWPLNVPGTLSADNLNASLYRAGFGFNAKYGVIIYVNVPLGAINIELGMILRPQNTWAGGLPADICWNFYGRTIYDDAAVGAWSVLYKKVITINNNVSYKYIPPISIPVATLNLTPSRLGNITIYRDAVDADDTLADQAISVSLHCIKVAYS
jgi:hypothetical protein